MGTINPPQRQKLDQTRERTTTPRPAPQKKTSVLCKASLDARDEVGLSSPIGEATALQILLEKGHWETLHLFRVSEAHKNARRADKGTEAGDYVTTRVQEK